MSYAAPDKVGYGTGPHAVLLQLCDLFMCTGAPGSLNPALLV